MRIMKRTDQGFNNPADHLIEAIKQDSERTDGKVLTSREILNRAVSILEERL